MRGALTKGSTTVMTPPARTPTAAAASATASEDRHTRFRISRDSAAGACQTLTAWLPMATLWVTNDTLPGATRRPQPGALRPASARPPRSARP